jgi:lipoprotein-anchoring transpeptidase ErfK/SrfK
MRRLLWLLAAVVTTVGLSACGGGGGPAAAPADPTAPPTSIDKSGALVARTTSPLAVFADPSAPQAAHVLPATTSFGSARALLVTEDRGEWLQVALPVRPNGSTGWVHRADVTVRSTDLHIDVDLTAKTLTVRDGDAIVLTTPVAIGAADVPTPAGRFYVVDKLATGAPNGPYGPFALGLSAHSDVLTEFGGGDGQVGIHGTNDPSSIGKAVSHGCIRVPNPVAQQLNDLIPLGTPVNILP